MSHPGALLAVVDGAQVLGRFLSARVRPDGRGFEETREASLGDPVPLDVLGSAVARIGLTEAFCSVATSDKDCEFTVTVGTSGRDAQFARAVELMLADAYSTLRVGSVQVAVVCVRDEGSLVDCCGLAVACAFADADLDVWALPLTCAVFDSQVLADPTRAEAKLSTLVTVFCGLEGQVLKVKQHPGGSCATTPAVLRRCLQLALTRADSLKPLLASARRPS